MTYVSASAPGCLVRTDYVAIMRLVRDNPGIMKIQICQAIGAGGTATWSKRIAELVESGMISETVTDRAYHYTVTKRGLQLISAIEMIPGVFE